MCKKRNKDCKVEKSEGEVHQDTSKAMNRLEAAVQISMQAQTMDPAAFGFESLEMQKATSAGLGFRV